MNLSTQPVQSLSLSSGFLTAADIHMILSLQALVFQSLDGVEKKYIVPKDAAKLESHFQKGGKAIGLFDDQQLVGQCILHLPINENDKPGVMVSPLSDQEEADSSVIQGLVVAPHYQGQNLAHFLVHVWKQAMVDLEKPHILSEVVVSNIKSLAVFLNMGLQIKVCTYDPEDEVFLYILHANLHKEQGIVSSLPTAIKFVDYTDINTIKSMLEDGYIGHCWKKGNPSQLGFSLELP